MVWGEVERITAIFIFSITSFNNQSNAEKYILNNVKRIIYDKILLSKFQIIYQSFRINKH